MYPVIPSTMTVGAAQVVVCLITTVLLFCTFMLRARA
jgi:hypothetical protein